MTWFEGNSRPGTGRYSWRGYEEASHDREPSEVESEPRLERELRQARELVQELKATLTEEKSTQPPAPVPGKESNES